MRCNSTALHAAQPRLAAICQQAASVFRMYAWYSFRRLVAVMVDAAPQLAHRKCARMRSLRHQWGRRRPPAGRVHRSHAVCMAVHLPAAGLARRSAAARSNTTDVTAGAVRRVFMATDLATQQNRQKRCEQGQPASMVTLDAWTKRLRTKYIYAC